MHAHTCQEVRAKKALNDVVQQNVTADLLQLLEDDSTLGPRILQLYHQGFFSKTEQLEETEKIDPDGPFSRGETHHNRLTMRKLDYLFRQLGLRDETVDALCTKTKLQSCRWLWCWFADVEMSDKLPTTTLSSLVNWALNRSFVLLLLCLSLASKLRRSDCTPVGLQSVSTISP
jgi:hypothetical protein